MTNLEKLRDEFREDPHYREMENENELEYTFIRDLIQFQIDHHLTRTQLAELIEMKQSNLSRLLSGHHSPSLETVNKIYLSLGKKVTLVVR
jgi:hypothetical protein